MGDEEAKGAEERVISRKDQIPLTTGQLRKCLLSKMHIFRHVDVDTGPDDMFDALHLDKDLREQQHVHNDQGQQ